MLSFSYLSNALLPLATGIPLSSSNDPNNILLNFDQFDLISSRRTLTFVYLVYTIKIKMQFKLTLLALATAVAAQDLSQLPQCAAGPAIAAIGSTGWALTDFACICKDTSFLQTLQPQIEAACSPADLQSMFNVFLIASKYYDSRVVLL